MNFWQLTSIKHIPSAVLNMPPKKALCPINAARREWIDRRWNWLEKEFGPETTRRSTIVLPRAQFFPERYSGFVEDVHVIFKRVCEYMGIDPKTAQLYFYEDHDPIYEDGLRRGTSGLYRAQSGVFEIWLEVTNLDDPVGMVATLAHEVAHIHLLGHGRISDEEEDHEPLTDLLTVFLGLGVIAANSVIQEHNWNHGQFSGWSLRRRGYLSMPEYGYALALLARCRDEVNPQWAKLLRPDVRSAFQQGCRFLNAPESERSYPVELRPDDQFAREEDDENSSPLEDEHARFETLDADGEVEGDPDDESIEDFQIAFAEEEPDEEESAYAQRSKLAQRISRIVAFCYTVGIAMLGGGLMGFICGQMIGSLVGYKQLGEITFFFGAFALAGYVVWRIGKGFD